MIEITFDAIIEGQELTVKFHRIKLDTIRIKEVPDEDEFGWREIKDIE